MGEREGLQGERRGERRAYLRGGRAKGEKGTIRHTDESTSRASAHCLGFGQLDRCILQSTRSVPGGQSCYMLHNQHLRVCQHDETRVVERRSGHCNDGPSVNIMAIIRSWPSRPLQTQTRWPNDPPSKQSGTRRCCCTITHTCAPIFPKKHAVSVSGPVFRKWRT